MRSKCNAFAEYACKQLRSLPKYNWQAWSPIQPERRATPRSAPLKPLADHSFIFADYSFFDTCVVAWVRQRELLIRVALRRRAGEQRKASLAALGQAAVEIDLSKEFPRTVSELARILFTADPRKSWLCNPRAAALSAQMQPALTARALEQRLEQQAAAKARQEQRQREAAERARHVAAAKERDARPRRDVVGTLPDAAPVAKAGVKPVKPAKPTKPADMSLNIEYRSREGRLWLLHSEGAEIFFKIEPAAEQALHVLERCGAVQEEGGGVYRISKEGWSGASIELNRSWLAVRSVSGSAESGPL